jgi:hypothetical protein
MKNFICNDCNIIFEIEDKECEGYYNWECPQCGHISPKEDGLFMYNKPSNQISKQVLKKEKIFVPDMDKLDKKFGMEQLNRPYTDFIKK